jgi:hypothetical protein
MQFISDDDLFRRLVFDNPWWESAAGKTEISSPPSPEAGFFSALSHPCHEGRRW